MGAFDIPLRLQTLGEAWGKAFRGLHVLLGDALRGLEATLSDS
jgi:hypothetical protein